MQVDRARGQLSEACTRDAYLQVLKAFMSELGAMELLPSLSAVSHHGTAIPLPSCVQGLAALI